MQIYSVFERPGGGAAQLADPGRGVIFVKEGFCWPALLWPMLWALYHRMWLVSAIYIAISVVIGGLGEWLGAEHPLAVIAALSFALIAATESNRIRGWHLVRQGYHQVASVAANTLALAEMRYFGDRLQPPAANPAPGPVLGPIRLPRADWGFMVPDPHG